MVRIGGKSKRNGVQPELLRHRIDLVIRGPRIHRAVHDLNGLLPECRIERRHHDVERTAVGDWQANTILHLVEERDDGLKDRLDCDREVLSDQISPRREAVFARVIGREQRFGSAGRIEIVRLASETIVQDVRTGDVHEDRGAIQHRTGPIRQQAPLFLFDGLLLDLITEPVINRREKGDRPLRRSHERNRLHVTVLPRHTESAHVRPFHERFVRVFDPHELIEFARELRVHFVTNDVEVPVEVLDESFHYDCCHKIRSVSGLRFATLQLPLDFGLRNLEQSAAVVIGQRLIRRNADTRYEGISSRVNVHHLDTHKVDRIRTDTVGCADDESGKLRASRTVVCSRITHARGGIGDIHFDDRVGQIETVVVLTEKSLRRNIRRQL